MKRVLKNSLALFAFTLCLCSCGDKKDDNQLPEGPVDGKITSFSVSDQKLVPYVLDINEETNIISYKTALPPHVNINDLTATFKTNGTSQNQVVLKINDEVQVSGKTKKDFSSDVVYDVYSGGIKQKSYTVKLSQSAYLNNFLTFSFPDRLMGANQSVINTETGKITLKYKVPSDIDISALTPVFTVTDNEYSTVKVNGVVQKSGVTVQSFATPVVYTVEASDGTTKNFTVTIEKFGKTSYTNPIIAGSYADPTVIRVGNMFYLYVTSGRVRGYSSTDMKTWNKLNGSVSEVFNTKPNFTGDPDDGLGMWAPDINYFDGKYVMYYSMSVWGGGATCGIGIGVSTYPQGPFLPPSGNPNGKLFVSAEIGVHNSIDPCFYEENGKRYLFWGSFNGIYMTELTADGMAVKDLSKKTKVAGKSFEATYIHKRGNYYYLFASVGACCDGMTSSYKVVVGRSENLAGPYLSKTGALMTSFDAWNPTNYQPVVLKANLYYGGPGHNSRIITDDNGSDWMFYHAYVNGSNDRQLLLDKVEWTADGWPTVGDGTPSTSIGVIPYFK